MKSEVHYCAHKSLPLVPTLGQNNPGNTVTFYVCKIHFIFLHLGIGLPNSFLPGFPSNFVRTSGFSMRTIWHALSSLSRSS